MEVGAAKSERPTVKAHRLRSYCLSSVIRGLSSLTFWSPPISPRGSSATNLDGPRWARERGRVAIFDLKKCKILASLHSLYTEGAFNVT
jgi:hypothetical protein